MATDIVIVVEEVEIEAVLNDSPVAAALARKLPVEVTMSRWGDEYYGTVGIGMKNDPDAHDDMEVGDLAYWPTGDAFCIFFGPTPMSSGSQPRAASAVTVVGRVTGDNLGELRRLGGSITAKLGTR